MFRAFPIRKCARSDSPVLYPHRGNGYVRGKYGSCGSFSCEKYLAHPAKIRIPGARGHIVPFQAVTGADKNTRTGNSGFFFPSSFAHRKVPRCR